MLYNFLLGLETLLSITIVVLILLHRGRGSEAGAVFTGSASASVFGSRGSTPFLTKLIASLAFVFILNSLSLAYIANRDFGSGSVISGDSIMQDPGIDRFADDSEEDLPIDEGIIGDELIDDIPEQIPGAGGDSVDVPALWGEEDSTQQTQPAAGTGAEGGNQGGASPNSQNW